MHTLSILLFSYANKCDARTASSFAADRLFPAGIIHRAITVSWNGREYGRAQFRRS